MSLAGQLLVEGTGRGLRRTVLVEVTGGGNGRGIANNFCRLWTGARR